MLDKMKYINGKGQEVLLGSGNILLGNNDVRNYSWNYSTLYEVIASFSRGQSTKKVPITIFGEDAYNTANKIYDIFIYDVLNKKPGKLYVGDYYMQGYFYASQKTTILKNGIYQTTLSFVSDTGVWIKENLQIGRSSGRGAEFLDYPIDYNYDYYIAGVNAINNESVADSDFKLLIYGNDLQSVSIVIGSNTYEINEPLAVNEYITLDTLNKTITKTDVQGNVTNIFSKRNKINNIFQKIPSGRSNVYFSGFDWELTIYQERSEPRWT